MSHVTLELRRDFDAALEDRWGFYIAEFLAGEDPVETGELGNKSARMDRCYGAETVPVEEATEARERLWAKADELWSEIEETGAEVPG